MPIPSKNIADFTIEKLFIWFYGRNVLKIKKKVILYFRIAPTTVNNYSYYSSLYFC